MRISTSYLVVALALTGSAPAIAGVDKVYSPTVEVGETEIELRGIHNLDGSDEHKAKLGIGYGASSTVFIEGYLIGEKEDGDFELEEAELEAKFQLSEQGEYWADFGMLVELEKVLEDDKWEAKLGPIVQKQFGNYVATANLLAERQFGSDRSSSETEVLGSMQFKYRMGEALEPGIEYYADEEISALGPVLLGNNRVSNSKLKWELGLMLGLNDDTADTTLRWQMEWEF